jgi:CRP-like cAMP-binding protein
MLKSFFNNIHPVEDQVMDDYLALWQQHEVPKRQIMKAPGEVEKYFYFVLDGVQKSYYLHKDKEHVIAFAYPPSFSGIPESFLTQTPSRYFLETITKSSFVRISYKQHEAYLREHRAIETLYRKIAESFVNGLVQRQHEIMALSMEDRFRVFVDRSAHLLQIIPQKDIASYLNISPTNFSSLINRIRI